MKGTWIATLAAIAVLGASLTPTTAFAARRHHRSHHSLRRAIAHRQKTKNSWRNAAIASGAVTAYGLLNHKDTITALGAAGTAYSLSRYEHDRKSQSRMQHRRRRHRRHR